MIYNETSGLYEAVIPGQPENTVVKYLVIAWDKFNDHYAYWHDQGDFQQAVYCVYTVVPEFPSALILPIFVIATLIAVILYKRKRSP